MSRPPEPPSFDRLLAQASWTRRLARSLLGDESVAEDVLQETWESAQRHPPQTSGPVEPWLRASIRNRLLNRARADRRRDRREQDVEAGAADSPEELLARLEVHRRVVEAVARLPEPYRQTLLLRYFDELSSAQIGERLGLPAATVRGRLRTGLGLLRDDLDRGSGGKRAWMGAVLLLAGRAHDLGREPIPVLARAARTVTRHWVITLAIVGAGAATVSMVTRPAPAPLSIDERPPAPSSRARAHAAAPPAAPVVATQTDPASATPSATPAPAAAAVAVVPAAAAAALVAISGQVRMFRGAAPPAAAPAPVDMSADGFCASQPPLVEEGLVAREDGGVANAVVRVIEGVSASPAPPAPALLVQRGCRYEPRVLVVHAGQKVLLRNEDQTVHAPHGHVHVNTTFTGSLGIGTPVLETAAPAAGQFARVTCDVHPWMTALLVGVDNPYFAITDADGRFTLPPLPPGRYTIEAWHEQMGKRSREVTIEAGRPTPAADIVLGFERLNLSNRVSDGRDGLCWIAVQGDNPVVKACKEGGIKRAKATMKAMQKAAKAKGLKFECDDCHKDGSTGTWTLNNDAEEKFKKLLAVSK